VGLAVATPSTLFISRHKVLKDAYLFSADLARVERATSEVAAYDQQLFDSLTLLRANAALDLTEQQWIDELWAPLEAYQSASRSALDVVRAEPDHYVSQQAATELTYLKDRPISAALVDLARHITSRAADEAAEVLASGRRIFALAVGATLAALVLGLAVGTTVITTDMTERKRTDAALRGGAARLRIESERLLALHRASTVLAGQTGDPSAVFDEVLSSAVALIGTTSGSLHRWLPDEGILRAVRSVDVSERHTTPDVRPGEGIAGRAFARLEPIIVNDYPAWEHALAPARAGHLRAADLGLGVVAEGVEDRPT
jgi:hypothetical protein